ncbi:hypothetical protein NEMBOFW57_001754 [Staphylotrichum longicolle]|uniref:Uncharacterized protein n=1 Tax=Staphylotrichum longicolle TaxID=669026 RepID=A0AAD4F247_9PEZI|nr:hypothetical protein NEMBOFW57_001754 [Staphylotrichum longicolle]
MCHIPQNVYTVCAHKRVGEVVECEKQKTRNEKLQHDGWCADLLMSLRSCRPVQETKIKYRFCEDCRDYYKDYEVNTLNAILSYWAFKSELCYSFDVSPKLIPVDLVFGEAGPVLQDPLKPRCELIALGKALPRKPFEASVKWLQRLEKARNTTLEIAEMRSQAPARRQRRGTVVSMQPRITTPMSIYPYSYLSSITEVSDSQETTAGVPRSHETGEYPQVHHETLQQLCGKVHVPSTRCLTSINYPQQSMSQENVIGMHTQNEDSLGGTSGTLVGGRILNSGLNNAALESEEPNMTSHFSVSDIDHDEAEELASTDAVSPLSSSFPVDDAIPALETQANSRIPEEHEGSENGKCVVVGSKAGTTVLQSNDVPGLSRDILEDRVSAAGANSSEESWDDVEL